MVDSSEPGNRFTLPIPDEAHVGLTTYDAKDPDASFPPIRPLRPPAGAPNVLLVLLDDVGFGASSAFGGPCRTPTAERLAAGGLKLTRFHTTALCAPSRRPCSQVATITVSAWARCLTSRRRRLATTRSAPRPPRPLPKCSSSTGTPLPSSASAMRCRCGRRARSARSTSGPPAVASSTSTASSAAAPTSGIPRCTKERRRSTRPLHPMTDTT
jgi:Sulfatase